MIETLQRHIPIEGTHNFRDIGGYPTRDGGSVRWRTWFRSDGLHALTPAGIETLRGLGIRCQIDLRSATEIAAFPSVFADGAHLAYNHLPVFIDNDKKIPKADTLEEFNVKLLDHAGDSLALILTSLARPDATPAVVNCAAGKDRTGLIVGMLLDLAGVDEATIVDDYVMTAEHGQELLAQLIELGVGVYGRDREQVTRMMDVRPEVMSETLNYLHVQYGGTAKYMERIGMPHKAVDSLRRALLDA